MTILTALRAKKAADAARIASENTRARIFNLSNIIECTTAITSLEEAFRHSRMGSFALIPDRLMQAKKSIVLVKETAGYFTDEQRVELQAILTHISICLKISETIDVVKNCEKKITRLNYKISELIERIMHILAAMQNYQE